MHDDRRSLPQLLIAEQQRAAFEASHAFFGIRSLLENRAVAGRPATNGVLGRSNYLRS
jgi:hypothetical protein